ncbi:hypothetical protein GJ496_005096 [Pomphorhynchus laevis]|nr:hypothetical protein GJ496_005096 [Pomphorhynchus laevis]
MYFFPEIAPFNIIATPLNRTCAQISWNFSEFNPLVNGELRKFTLYYTIFTEDGVHGLKQLHAPPNVRSIILPDLKSNTSYRLQLSASTNKGDGIRSKSMTLVMPPDKGKIYK